MSESENSIEKDSNSKVYELGYLLVPSIKEEDVPVSYGNLKELILSLGGELVSDEMPKMITLAYSMQRVTSNIRSRFSTAYFGWTKFVMEPENVLILKTVRENTIAAKRFPRSEMYKRPKTRGVKTEAAVPINKEAIDKEIDALIAV